MRVAGGERDPVVPITVQPSTLGSVAGGMAETVLRGVHCWGLHYLLMFRGWHSGGTAMTFGIPSQCPWLIEFPIAAGDCGCVVMSARILTLPAQ